MSEPLVSGRYVGAFLESAGMVSSVFERKAANILESNGIDDVDPDDWYSADKFVSAINEIESEVGEKTSEQAGVKMIEIVPEISGLSSMEEAIEVGKEPHRQSYQNFSTEEVGDLKYDSTGRGPDRVAYYGGWEFPQAFTRGIFKGFAKGVDGLSPNSIEPTEAKGDEVYAFEVQQ